MNTIVANHSKLKNSMSYQSLTAWERPIVAKQPWIIDTWFSKENTKNAVTTENGPKLELQKPTRLAFKNIAAHRQSVVLAFVGDLLPHGYVQRDAAALANHSIENIDERAASGYRALFKDVEDDLARADITIGNLEAPLARHMTVNGLVKNPELSKLHGPPEYTTFPRFNAHPGFALALSQIGFDVLLTANNHSLDRNSAGIDATLNALDSFNIKHLGTVKKTELDHGKYPQDKRYLIYEKNGLRIGLLNYTQVINMYQSPQVSQIQDGTIFEDIESLRARSDIDLVVVTVHWGDDIYPTTRFEVAKTPNSSQKRWAQKIAEAGADVIIGSHPHVLQPIEKIITTTAQQSRETLVCYSLGNFIANQGQRDHKTHKNYVPYRCSAIVYVKLNKDENKASISDVRYVPVVIDKRKPIVINESSADHQQERKIILDSLEYPDNAINPQSHWFDSKSDRQ